MITELQRIPTSGARAVEAFTVDGMELLAIPQLARDVPGGPAGMNGGDSDAVGVLLLRRGAAGGDFEPWAELPGPGGEDAEFFTIGDRAFLAVASIRTGAGPYSFATSSGIFEWVAGRFAPFQQVDTFAAKQWKHWRIGGRHFLGLAQGVAGAGLPERDSVVYEWDGSSFVEHQRIPSRWAYNWHAFIVGDAFFVAHADHVRPSMLYRWDGALLRPHQELAADGGRAFATFISGGVPHLIIASLSAPSRVTRWDGARFRDIQVLDGLGARELAIVRRPGRLLVVRVNFILGTPAFPSPALSSQIYDWDGSGLRVVAEFPTCGGTDVAVLGGVGLRRGAVRGGAAQGNGAATQENADAPGSGAELIVSNSLTPDVRFGGATVRYALTLGVG